VTKLDEFRAIITGEAPGPPVGELIGLRLTAIEKGQATFELDAGPQHASPLGTMHGGILCDLADAAMGCAYASQLADEESFTTLELKINFLKPIWEGRLVAVATVVKAGRSVGLSECKITDRHDNLVAYATSTLVTLRGDAAKGR